ncbi:hypothetical protein F2P56_034981, partial [Juglans regia]
KPSITLAHLFSFPNPFFPFLVPPSYHLPHAMAEKSGQILSTLFLILMFLNFLGMTRPDEVCPYPCYPPPIGSGTPIITTQPPPPPSQVVSYPPPAGYNPTPAGYVPYSSPPPYGNSLGSPPPPDPILPYFPYYSGKPLHQTDNSAATTLGIRSILIIIIAVANYLLVSVSIFPFYVL